MGLLGNGPFWTKSWPEAFWSQILAICGLPGRNSKRLLNYCETAVFGQILARSLLEPDFGNLPASGSLWEAPGKLLGSFENSRKRPCPCVKRAAVREHQGTSVFPSKIFPVGRVEPDAVFGHFEALFCFSEACNVVLAA